jgi:hypothetical protein
MTRSLTIDCALPPARRGYKPRRRERASSVQPGPAIAGGRIPRVSRLMALALRLDAVSARS